MLVNSHTTPKGADKICFTLLHYTRINKNIRYYKRPDSLHKTALQEGLFTKVPSRPYMCLVAIKAFIVFASTTHRLSLFHSSITLFVNEFFRVSFLNLNLSCLYPLLDVLTAVFNKSTSFKSLFSISCIHLSTLIKSKCSQRLFREYKLSSCSF